MIGNRRFLLMATAGGAVAAALLGGCGKKEDPIAQAEKKAAAAGVPAPGIAETKAIMEEAYVYGFPMVAAYKAMVEFNVDKSSSQYKAPFNEIWNDSQTFTPKDTAIPTPNSDTPYSMVQADLRAEPIVLCVPKVDKNRYYSVMLADLYAFNYGYIGSRATGSDAGCYLVAGPRWQGEKPAGINQVFRSETDFSLMIYRTQLFNPADIENVKKIQAGYTVQPLSAFLKQPAAPAAPAIDFPKFVGDDPFKTEFPAYLDFLLQFAPAIGPAAVEEPLRAKFASIGIGPGKKFDFKDLSIEHKAAVGLAIKEGFEKIDKAAEGLGKEINGWQVGAAFGDRAFYKGDWLLRAAAAKAGIYGNDAVEAMYPQAHVDSEGQTLDGSKHKYTLTFAKDQFPPVNAFWSITMYDGKNQLLVDNPINRYLINSPMLPGMKKNADGSLTLTIQKDSPGKAKEANWLPAPDGPIYLVMRLYWPKDAPPSILPAGEGTWNPPGLKRVQ
ncbi:MAG: DUF1254 domain-containing protein [Ideonella sp.]|nr:DUF1254 domain-containing protein [Ideonella sp.]